MASSIQKAQKSNKKDDDMSEMFASLEIAQSVEVSTKVISSVINTYSIFLPGINGITCSDDDTTYFYHFQEEKLIKAKRVKNSMKIWNCRDVQVRGVTMTSKNELLFSPSPFSSLVVVSENGNEKTVHSSFQLQFTSYYFDKMSGLLLVGVINQGSLFEKSKVRQVRVFEDYNMYIQRRTIEFSGTGKRLFNLPFRITSDSGGNIYVVDLINKEKHGRVVAVDKEGNLKFTYNGYNNPKPFTPNDITTTPGNNIVIIDTSCDSVHVLQQDGQLLAKQDTRELDIQRPLSLCMDTEGYLVIGCNACKDNSDAKIHVVKMLF